MRTRDSKPLTYDYTCSTYGPVAHSTGTKIFPITFFTFFKIKEGKIKSLLRDLVFHAIFIVFFACRNSFSTVYLNLQHRMVAKKK